MYGVSLWLESRDEQPSVNEISGLKRSDVNFFDRSAVDNRSSGYAKASDALLGSLLLGGIGTVFCGGVSYGKDGVQDVGALFAEGFVLNMGLNNLVKVLVDRKRPYLYNDSVSAEDRADRYSDPDRSFYSGHTSNAFFAAAFITSVCRDFYRDSKWSTPISILSFVAAVSVGICRYKAGKHYPSDIIVGAAVGTLIGFGIPYLHKKDSPVKGGSDGNGFTIAFSQTM